MSSRSVAVVAVLVLAVVACGDTSPGADEGPQSIRLVTHDSFAISDSVIAEFEESTGHTIEILTVGDVGTMVNQAVLAKGNPIGDVMYGIDNTFLGRALQEELFIPYESPRVSSVPENLQLDERVTPIDFGDVCLNYDVAGLAARDLEPPRQLRDLADRRYAGLVSVQHPGTSSPGLAFVLSTIAEFGEGGDYTWLDFWGELAANDVLVNAGWEEAYYGSFSGGTGTGDRPIVVSYASSPPVEVLFAESPLTEAPTAVIEAGCFRQIEFAGILEGTPVPNAAKELIDFMLDLRFQEDIPLNMFVFPSNGQAALPDEFVEFTEVPANPASILPEEIDANRSRWIEEWVEVVTP